MSQAIGPDDDTHYHLLRPLEENPEAAQRELAEAMSVSVGKANYLQFPRLRQQARLPLPAHAFRRSRKGAVYPALPGTPQGGIRAHLHVVASWDEAVGVCHMITAYYPDEKHFGPDLRTRRR